MAKFVFLLLKASFDEENIFIHFTSYDVFL
jgi:hypothetical protein